MTKTLSEKLARGARVMCDTSQLKTQHPEWLLNEMADSADLLDEAAALARRVEAGSVITATATSAESLKSGEESEYDFSWETVDEALRAAGVKPGQRVRLVLEVEP